MGFTAGLLRVNIFWFAWDWRRKLRRLLYAMIEERNSDMREDERFGCHLWYFSPQSEITLRMLCRLTKDVVR